MKLDQDLLSVHDRELLQQFAESLHGVEEQFAQEWLEAWLVAKPEHGFDPDAYRQVLWHIIKITVMTQFDLLRRGEFEQVYEMQYQLNRNAARPQLSAGAITVATQADLHRFARAAQPVVQRWIRQFCGDDVERCLRTMLAQERFSTQMTQIISEAYSDEREAYMHQVSDKLSQSLDLTRQLASLSQALVQSLDTGPVLDLAMQSAVQLLHTDGAALMLIDDTGSILRMHTLVGAEIERLEQPISVSGTLAGWVYTHNAPLRSDQLPNELLGKRLQLIRHSAVRDLVIVPLRMGGQAVGTMAVVSESERSFTDSETQVLQTLADYAAIAIGNARTHASVREAGERAELANRAKSEFVAAVSHEIRTPLNAVIGYVEMLRDPLLDAEEIRHCLNRLEQIAHSAHRLTDDLLENARREAGRLQLAISRVELPPLLDEIAETVRVLVEGKSIEVRVQVPEPCPSVRADPDRLRQIVVNLVSNAAKFTEQGAIDLQITAADPGQIELHVRDSGVGVDPDDLPHLFELFYRGRGSDAATGAGIGLFLSRQLANLMKGDIQASRQPQGGTCFTVTLPAYL